MLLMAQVEFAADAAEIIGKRGAHRRAELVADRLSTAATGPVHIHYRRTHTR
jgi:hypothetical protein